MIPSGVHGRSPGRFFASRPAEIGVRPSTSFFGAISSVSAGPSTCGGVGSWSRMPLTFGSALSPCSSALTSPWVASAPSRWSKPRMPASALAFCLPLT